MKKTLSVFLSVVGMLSVASASQSPSAKGYLQGSVVKVEKVDQPQFATGSNPSDAPLPDPETYTYDVSVHLDCGTYVARYENWYDYVPSVLTPNQTITLRLTRGSMYVDVPNRRELPMRIVSRSPKHGFCNNGSSQSR